MTGTMLLVVLLAMVAPLAYFVITGWRDYVAKRVGIDDDWGVEALERSLINTDDFFSAGRALTIPEYAVTTVASGLQMAAVVLFAQWGYYYGYWALLVPAAWCLGFLLLSCFASGLEGFLSRSQTLHTYLGEAHGATHDGKARAMVRLASMATVLGLGGALFAELAYTAELVQRLLGRSDPFRYMVMAFFLASVLAYALPGGFRAVVETDERQLPLAYLGLAVMLAAIIFAGRRLGVDNGATTVIGGLSFATIAVVAFIGLVKSARKREGMRPLTFAVPIASLGLVVLAYEGGQTLVAVRPSVVLLVPEPWHPQTIGFVPAVSLVIANVLWQFVDLSVFQRLTALELPKTRLERAKAVRRAILWTGLESPVSWCIGIAIGFGLGQMGVFGGADGAWRAYEAFLGAMLLGDGVAAGLSTGLRAVIVGVSLSGFIAITLSTVDSLGSALAYTAAADLVGSRTALRNPTGRARLVTFVVLLLDFALLALWQSTADDGHSLSTWLYTAYSVQLSLFGVSLSALLGVRLSSRYALGSVVAGAGLGVLLGLLVLIHRETELLVLPPIGAVVGSICVIFVPLLKGLRRRRQEASA